MRGCNPSCDRQPCQSGAGIYTFALDRFTPLDTKTQRTTLRRPSRRDSNRLPNSRYTIVMAFCGLGLAAWDGGGTCNIRLAIKILPFGTEGGGGRHRLGEPAPQLLQQSGLHPLGRDPHNKQQHAKGGFSCQRGPKCQRVAC